MTFEAQRAAPSGSDSTPQVSTDLPPLEVGTPKQIGVAERIRRDFVGGVNGSLLWWMGLTNSGDTSIRRHFGELMPPSDAQKVVGAIERSLRTPKCLDANYWLDNHKRKPFRAGRIAVTEAYRRIGQRQGTGSDAGQSS